MIVQEQLNVKEYKPVILCVDDERIILDSLKLQLTNYFEDSCHIEIAESGEEALEVLADMAESNQAAEVVISDQIMPNMRGDQLLAEVSGNYPNSIRILLTGQADKDDIVQAINNAGLYRYISKPWDNMDLNLTVKEALISFGNQFKIEQQRDQLLELNKDLEKKVQERTQALAAEKEKSDGLLLNILPSDVVEELKVKDFVEPKHFDLATIAFIDIVGFTRHSKRLAPKEIISQLNIIFHLIDEIVEFQGLEKIKTMGDGYMFVGGIPVPNTTNPIDVVRACINIQEKMMDLKKQNMEKGLPPWDLRIGVHSGELVAGVIGKKKFAYDVWGNTVNTASRIESSGIAGEVNVSEATYHLIKDEFHFEPRGNIKMKNMGEMQMYFVSNAKGQYCDSEV